MRISALHKAARAQGSDHEYDARAEMANTGYFHADLATLGGSKLQLSDDPHELFGWKPMKHRQVSRKEVSIRQKMRLPVDTLNERDGGSRALSV